MFLFSITNSVIQTELLDVAVLFKKVLLFLSTRFFAVVATLLNFVRMFTRAHEENCKQLEFEKKRAQKEAVENDKIKVNHKQDSIKSGDIK